VTDDETPAAVDWLGDVDPSALAYLSRAAEDRLRAQGRIRELVLHVLARGAEPSLPDVEAALREAQGEPVPAEVLDYACQVLRGLPRRPGRRGPTLTTFGELVVRAFHQRALANAQDAEVNVLRRAGAADRKTATKFNLSARTVQRIVRPRRWLRP
jgi:hypothetical protein